MLEIFLDQVYQLQHNLSKPDELDYYLVSLTKTSN